MGKGMLRDWQRLGVGRRVGREGRGGEGEAERVDRKEGGGEWEMAMGRERWRGGNGQR